MRKNGYKLSNGKAVDHYPYLFDERKQMVNEAKEVQNRLKFTKRLKGKELREIWLSDPDVLRYRELMKRIWTFETDIFIVGESYICESPETCTESESLWKVERKGPQSSYPDILLLCKEHLNKMVENYSHYGYTFTFEEFKE